MIRSLRHDAKKVAKAKKYLAFEAERRQKMRAKAKWDAIAWSHLNCVDQAVNAGLGRDAVGQIDQLVAECRAAPGAKLEGMLAFFKIFGTLGGLLPEAERLRRFYGGYYEFVARNLGAPDLRYAEDVFLAPVVDPNAGVARGTNLVFVQHVVTSKLFMFGGTLAVRRGVAELYAYQQPVHCADQGKNMPKTLSFGDAEIDPINLSWIPGEVTLPGWFPSRLPDIPVVRIGTPDALFDIVAIEKEEATVTAGKVQDVTEGSAPRLNVKVRNTKSYGGIDDDKWIRKPQQKLMKALWAFRTGN